MIHTANTRSHQVTIRSSHITLQPCS